jgi:hypothetical protein
MGFRFDVTVLAVRPGREFAMHDPTIRRAPWRCGLEYPKTAADQHPHFSE